jgi:ABC-2 type transport system permease protein
MSFFEVFYKELRTIVGDTALMLTIIGGVVLYSFLYPQPYIKENVTQLRVGVVDNDKSSLSRELIFKIDATPQVDVVGGFSSQKEALEALKHKKIRAFLILPANLQRKLQQGQSPKIALAVDNSYFLIFGGVLEGVMKSVLTQTTAMKAVKYMQKEYPLESAIEATTPYSLETINLFNPNNSYTQYVIPAVFVLILQQTMLIGMGMLGGGIRENLEHHKDSYLCSSGIWQLYGSRLLFFGVLYFFYFFYYFGWSFSFFEIIHVGDFGELLVFGCVFIMASFSFGWFLSSVVTSREVVTPAILFSSLPLVFSVGFVWPLEEIPSFIHTLSLFIPSTPAMEGLLKLNQMGADFSSVSDNINILLLQTLFYTFLGYYYMQKQRKHLCQNLKM